MLVFDPNHHFILNTRINFFATETAKLQSVKLIKREELRLIDNVFNALLLLLLIVLVMRFLFPASVLVIISYWIVDSLPLTGQQPVFHGLNQTQQDELHAILFNQNATRSSIRKGIEKWVNSQNNQTLSVLKLHFSLC